MSNQDSTQRQSAIGTDATQQETRLADELQLITLLKETPDFFERHPDVLAEIEVPHASGGAISLIERQVQALREKNKKLEKHLQNLVEVARDNDRLAQSRHRIAVNLLSARDLDDVISIVLDELGNELKADFAVIKLFSDDEQRQQANPELFFAPQTEGVNAFKTMREQKNPVCGRSSDEQKNFLFGKDAEKIESVAVIPLSAGAELGLIGLGSEALSRFQAGMGTEFLTQMGELVSAALAVHLEQHTG